MSSTDWRAMHGVVFLGLAAAVAPIPSFHVWPLTWIVPLAAYFALVAALAPLRRTLPPLRFGRVNRVAIVATLGIAFVSCPVLVAVHASTHADVSGLFAVLPVKALGGIILAGVLF